MGRVRRAPWEPPRDTETVERVQVGPFVTREVVRRADGSLLVYTGRRFRKGLGPRRIELLTEYQAEDERDADVRTRTG